MQGEHWASSLGQTYNECHDATRRQVAGRQWQFTQPRTITMYTVTPSPLSASSSYQWTVFSPLIADAQATLNIHTISFSEELRRLGEIGWLVG